MPETAGVPGTYYTYLDALARAEEASRLAEQAKQEAERLRAAQEAQAAK
jgi:hypothetical protein